MKIAVGGLWHETNTFSPLRTTIDDFREFQLSEGDDVIVRNRGVGNEVGGFIDVGKRLNFELKPLLFAGALPSAIVSGEAYQFIRDRMLQRLKAALPIDGVLLALHGAMVADGVDDVEADLLHGVRKITGVKCPIVITIDLHANLSLDVINLADVVVGYDKYPHTDIYERGCEASEVLDVLLRGTKVYRSFRKLPLLTVPQGQSTADEPMSSIMHSIHHWEHKPGILSISAAPGYPYSDVSRLGMTVVAYSTTGQDLADHCCQEIAALIWTRRKEFTVKNTPAYDAVRQAIAAPRGPVILVDVADNIGGGAPGNGTVLLRELVAQHAQGAVVTLADPQSVSEAIAAGIGHKVHIQAGGKSDSFHGDPVPLNGIVRLLSNGAYTHRGSYMTGLQVQMGRTAVIDSQGIEVVLMERKAMPFDAEQLHCLGIDPVHKKIIVVKSAIAWKAAYGDIAKQVIYVDTPGLCSSDLSAFTYSKRPRPMYPLEPETKNDN